MTKEATPRLYLDIDGVIIANNSPFETVQLNSLESYASEVVERLGSTGLELVWLSTWGNQASYLSERIPALHDATVLPMADHRNGMSAKRNALISDQERYPSPFAWVDDMINDWTRRVVAKRLSVPKLLVRPDSDTGINESDLMRIEAFATKYQV